MNTSIHKPKTVNTNNFEFGDITVNKYGGKSCKVRYTGSDFYLQIPRSRLPYGLGVYEEKDPNSGAVTKSKYSLNFSLQGYEVDADGVAGNQRIRDFFELLEKLEKLLYTKASENSQEWLGIDDATPAVAKALCRDLIIYPKDKITKKITKTSYAPTFKAKMNYWDNNFSKIYNSDREPMTTSDFMQSCIGGSEAIAILKLGSVNFAGGKCGYSWTVDQLILYPRLAMNSFAFQLDEEDNKPAAVKASSDDESSVPPSNEPSKSEMVEDSDDDEDDELDDDDEEEETPREPSPPPAPKKVIKKKAKKKDT